MLKEMVVIDPAQDGEPMGTVKMREESMYKTEL